RRTTAATHGGRAPSRVRQGFLTRCPPRNIDFPETSKLKGEQIPYGLHAFGRVPEQAPAWSVSRHSGQKLTHRAPSTRRRHAFPWTRALRIVTENSHRPLYHSGPLSQFASSPTRPAGSLALAFDRTRPC